MEDKMSSRTREANGINFHMNFRLFTDPLVFSFLDEIDKSNIKSIISNRYKYFDQKGVFDYYKQYMSDHNCVSIDITDIDWYVTEIIEKVIGQGPTIDKLHKTEYEKNNLKLPAENNLNREQIINELIPLEIETRFGREVNKDTLVSPEVMAYFKKGVKPITTSEKSDKNNLARFMKTHKHEIPERFRDEFLTYLEEFAHKNFILDDKYPYQEFGENAIKLLHLWKPENDEKLSQNYNYFTKQFAEIIHTKETILSLGTSKKDGVFDDVPW
jgi:hypothetical protein